MKTTHPKASAVYEIRVQGELDPDWQAWFNGLAISQEPTGRQPGDTILTGPVADQAALRGLLCRLWDLNLTLLSVRRMEGGHKEEAKDD